MVSKFKVRKANNKAEFKLGKKIEFMRKLMTLACAMIMASVANATKVTTVAFDKTMVSVPARVRFVKGNDYGFTVEAKDSIVAKSLRCTVKEGVLRIAFGQSLQPGTSKYDARKDTYYYGINANNQILSEEDEADNLVITVTAPEMPRVKTTPDYVAVSTKRVEEARKATVGGLTMNE